MLAKHVLIHQTSLGIIQEVDRCVVGRALQSGTSSTVPHAITGKLDGKACNLGIYSVLQIM
jgi:hypothetical protein